MLSEMQSALVDWLIFYGISIIAIYLMPNPFIYIYIYIVLFQTIQVSS